MKRILSIILMIMMLIPILTFAVSAEGYDGNVIYLEDGGYIVVTVEMEPIWRSSGTKSGRTTYNYYDSNGVRGWTAVLNGTFTYTGSSATCTASSCNVTIYDSAWYIVSKSAGKSGNTATANMTMGKKLLGVTVTKVPANLTLTCDANGNLS